MREVEDQLAKGLYIPDEKIPTFSKAAEEWLKKKKPELSSTWSVYEGHAKNHFSAFDNIRIGLGSNMIAELKKWRVACLPNKLDLMFPNEEGKPTNYSNMVQRYYMPTLKNAKIKRIKFHCLRHTFASSLIHQGENNQIHSITAWSFVAHGVIEYLFSLDGSGQSGVSMPAGKNHFKRHWSQNGHKRSGNENFDSLKVMSESHLHGPYLSKDHKKRIYKPLCS